MRVHREIHRGDRSEGQQTQGFVLAGYTDNRRTDQYFEFQGFWCRVGVVMLEQLLIFTRGGLVLWTCQELGKALKGSPIDALIRYSKLAYGILKQLYV